jgi:hypothetical protein
MSFVIRRSKHKLLLTAGVFGSRRAAKRFAKQWGLKNITIGRVKFDKRATQL